MGLGFKDLSGLPEPKLPSVALPSPPGNHWRLKFETKCKRFVLTKTLLPNPNPRPSLRVTVSVKLG